MKTQTVEYHTGTAIAHLYVAISHIRTGQLDRAVREIQATQIHIGKIEIANLTLVRLPGAAKE